jgi:hypothetical protein
MIRTVITKTLTVTADTAAAAARMLRAAAKRN